MSNSYTSLQNKKTVLHYPSQRDLNRSNLDVSGRSSQSRNSSQQRPIFSIEKNVKQSLSNRRQFESTLPVKNSKLEVSDILAMMEKSYGTDKKRPTSKTYESLQKSDLNYNFCSRSPLDNSRQSQGCSNNSYVQQKVNYLRKITSQKTIIPQKQEPATEEFKIQLQSYLQQLIGKIKSLESQLHESQAESNQLKDDLEQSMARELVLADELRQSASPHIITRYQSRSRIEQELQDKTELVEKLQANLEQQLKTINQLQQTSEKRIQSTEQLERAELDHKQQIAQIECDYQSQLTALKKQHELDLLDKINSIEESHSLAILSVKQEVKLSQIQAVNQLHKQQITQNQLLSAEMTRKEKLISELQQQIVDFLCQKVEQDTKFEFQPSCQMNDFNNIQKVELRDAQVQSEETWCLNLQMVLEESVERKVKKMLTKIYDNASSISQLSFDRDDWSFYEPNKHSQINNLKQSSAGKVLIADIKIGDENVKSAEWIAMKREQQIECVVEKMLGKVYEKCVNQIKLEQIQASFEDCQEKFAQAQIEIKKLKAMLVSNKSQHVNQSQDISDDEDDLENLTNSQNQSELKTIQAQIQSLQTQIDEQKNTIKLQEITIQKQKFEKRQLDLQIEHLENLIAQRDEQLLKLQEITNLQQPEEIKQQDAQTILKQETVQPLNSPVLAVKTQNVMEVLYRRSTLKPGAIDIQNVLSLVVKETQQQVNVEEYASEDESSSD